MTDKQLPTNQATPDLLAKWGKVAAAVCAGILIAAIIGLIVFQQPIVIVKVITSTNQLYIFRTALIGLGTAAFVLMLIAVAIADATTDKRVRQFVIGFFGWPVLNAIAGILITMAFLIHCINRNCGFGEGYGLVLTLTVVLPIMNIGILIFLGITRRWWIVIGMVAAFAVSIVVYALK